MNDEHARELELLRHVQRIAQLGTWEWEAATGSIRWSDQMYRNYGVEPGSFTPTFEAIMERVHPDDRPSILASARTTLAEGRATRREYRVLRPDGSIRFIESRCEPEADADGHYFRLIGVDKDVTDRKLAEAAQRESEERYRQIVEMAQEGIWLLDRDERTLFANARMAEMLGTTVEELRGRSTYDFFAPEDVPAAKARFADRHRGVSARSLEIRYVLPSDGREVWVLGSIHSFYDAEAGRYDGVFGMFVDITERKKAQARVAQLASIVESSSDAIFSLGRDGRIETWNAGAERVYGWSAKEAIGASAAALVREQKAGELAACLERLDRGEPCPELDARHARKDGAPIDVTIAISRLQDARGRPVGAAVIARDVSERRRAAEALRKSEERFQQLVASNIFATVIGDHWGRITEASDSFLELVGRTRDELRAGKLRWDEMTAPEYAHLDRASVESLMTTGRFAPFEKEFLHKDGTRIPVLIGLASLDPAEHGGTAIGAVLDLRRLKAAEDAVRRAEDQLRQAQKMEAIGRLAGGIAHDFNNILAAITGYAELGLRKLESHEPVRGTFLEILAASDSAASLTRQLLAFGRKQVLQPRALDLNAVVLDMDRMLRRLIGDDVRLETRLEPDLWPVRADPGQLEQVIVNLAVNARDAMPRGGSLRIETRNVTGGGERPELEPGEWVLLAVTDEGTGMDAETLARAFEPFFTTKPLGKGTGLGLATVYGIVKQSEGHVSVASELGRGSRFEILLPRAEGAAGEWRRSTPLAASTGDETILLVEDNATVRALVHQLLEASGYQVLPASHPDEALALASRHEGPIDVLLTDVIMPGMNGPQLHERLEQTRPGLPVLFMSGHTAGVLHGPGGLAPGRAFIPKPFTLAALSAELRKVLAARVT